ncbi:MAG: maleylpyruvate isomerase N-terminal domain-containing protein, partial [Acidimicrobiia bacterium]|nr:maleylpyruvate isomerase N-terminal domain-containing protein [Acidimicrobiia bacterium]
VERYLEAAPVDGPHLEDAAAYVTRYLGARDDDPGGIDAAVAARGREESAALGEDPAALFAATFARVVARLYTVDPDTVIPTAWASIRIDDYLRTRVMELVLHGLDLAAALDVDWDPPAAALADTLLLLTEVAMRRGHGADLARLLAGRPATAAVLPVIR